MTNHISVNEERHLVSVLWSFQFKQIKDILYWFIELDGVYLNLKTCRVLAIFPKPNLKIAKPELKNKQKNTKIETSSNPFLNYRKFCQKEDAFWPNFGQNFFSQTRKLENSMSFESIFLNPKSSKSKNFTILKPKKLKPKPQRGNKTRTLKNPNSIKFY